MRSEYIEEQLDYRLNHTKQLYESVDISENLELEKIIYFKYYFDLATAIESITYSIVKTKYGQDKLINKKLSLDKKDNVSFFYTKGDIECIIDGFGEDIEPALVEKRFSEKIKVIKKSYFESKSQQQSVLEKKKFQEHYGDARKIRNQLAHDISFDKVKFNQDTLYSFLVIYCILIEYLKKEELQ